MIMDRLDRIELINELEKYVDFHESKANYYNDLAIEETIKLKTIGFVTTDNVLRKKLCFDTIRADSTTIEY
jgi:hypothetical protein